MSALAHAPRLFALVDCIWSLYPSTGSTILRTAYVREADGYFDAESGEDWCLGVSLAFRGRIGWSERPGRIYRLSGESVWAQHLGVHDQIDHARNVRRRIVADPGIAPWARRGLPLIAAGQYAAIAAHVSSRRCARSGGEVGRPGVAARPEHAEPDRDQHRRPEQERQDDAQAAVV